MKKLVLTKQNVYKYCHELWSWLAEDPNRRKSGWSEWDKTFKNIDIENDCFACEYIKRKKKLTNMSIKFCKECPLSELWGKDYCESDNSPYRKWVIGSRYGKVSRKYPKIRTVYALEIAEFCKKKLEEGIN